MADDIRVSSVVIDNRVAGAARGVYSTNSFGLLQVDEGLSVDEARGRIHGGLVGNNYDEALLRTADGRLFVLYDRTLPTRLRPGSQVQVAGEDMLVMDVSWTDSTMRDSQKRNNTRRGAAVGGAAGVILGDGLGDVLVGAAVGGLLGRASNNSDQIERLSPPRPESFGHIRSSGPSTLRGLQPPR